MDLKKAEKFVGFMEKTMPQEVHMPALFFIKNMILIQKSQDTAKDILTK